MSAEALYIVSDIDDVLSRTAPAVIEDLNEVFRRSNTLHTFSENFMEMSGTSFEETGAWWLDFCNRKMPYFEPAPGAQAAITRASKLGVVDNLTARRPIFSNITAAWIATHFPEVHDVRHAQIPWATDRNAHKRTKIDDLLQMQPQVYWEDQLKHVLPVARNLGTYTILVDLYGWNKGIELPPKVAYARCMEETADLTEAYAEQRAA